MFDNDKTILYMIRILREINNGSNSIKKISNDTNIPEAFTAKLIADLRQRGYFDSKYQLTKPFADIYLSELLTNSIIFSQQSVDLIKANLKISIKDIK